jgi:hypothetical protein
MQSGLKGLLEFSELFDKTQGWSLYFFVGAAAEPAHASQTGNVGFVILVLGRHPPIAIIIMTAKS